MNSDNQILKNQAVPAQTEKTGKQTFSFYQKLFFLYFLNLSDWLCTEVLIGSGMFSEANPIMQPILTSFWNTILIKGVLPLALILLCAFIYKIADAEQNIITNIILYTGITAYAFVNLWHIFNFVLLFCAF